MQYEVKALSITGKYGKTYKSGSIIEDAAITPDHIKDLLDDKAIAVYVPKVDEAVSITPDTTKIIK